MAEFLVILGHSVHVYLTLGPVTLGRAPLCSLILVFVSHHRWMNAIGQKKDPLHSLAKLDINIIGPERRAQVMSTWLIYEHYEPRTEAQLNLRSTAGQSELVAQ